MPPTPHPWFRMYSGTLDNLKVKKLKPALRWQWLELLMLANVSKPRGTLPEIDVIAYRLRITEEAARAFRLEMVARKLVDIKNGAYVMHDWDDWQKDRDVAPSKRVTKVTLSSPVNHAIDALTRDENVSREDESRREKEEEEEEKREEQTSRAPLGFVPQREPFFKDDDLPGFASEWVIHFRNRTGRDHPGPAVVADAMALEREFGREACMLAAADTLWEKGPSWLRPRLDEQRKRSLVGATPAAARPKDPRYD